MLSGEGKNLSQMSLCALILKKTVTLGLRVVTALILLLDSSPGGCSFISSFGILGGIAVDCKIPDRRINSCEVLVPCLRGLPACPVAPFRFGPWQRPPPACAVCTPPRHLAVALCLSLKPCPWSSSTCYCFFTYSLSATENGQLWAFKGPPPGSQPGRFQ